MAAEPTSPPARMPFFPLPALVLLLAGLGVAHAQETDTGALEHEGNPAGATTELPEEDTAAEPRIVVPGPATPVPAAPAGSGGPRVHIARIVVENATVVPAAAIAAIVADYEGRAISDAELQDLRQRLTRACTERGFIASYAAIPDQDLADDVLRIRMVEGVLARVEIRGRHHFDRAFLGRRIAAGLSRPLRSAELQDRLRVLRQDPLIAAIDARLRRGDRPGDTVLVATIAEGKRYALGGVVANDRSPLVGGVRGTINANARNLFGRGDTLAFATSQGDGLGDYDLNATLPISGWGTHATLRYTHTHSDIVEEPIDELHLESEADTLYVGLSQAFYETARRAFTLGLTFSRRERASFRDGEPFSGSPGVVEGKAAVSAARLRFQWVDHTPANVLSARVTLNFGLDAFGSTVHHDHLPDSDFLTTLTQLQWLHRFPGRLGQGLVRFEAQTANDALLPDEKYAIGGLYSVRGYRRGRLIRDHGWTGTLEYRWPAFLLPVPLISATRADGQVTLVAFADLGRAWDENPRFHEAIKKIYSVGPGLRWDLAREVRAELYWGHAFRDFEAQHKDLQDHGLHFFVSYRYAF